MAEHGKAVPNNSFDFVGVLVGNTTAGWLTGGPSPMQWFPYAGAGIENGVLYYIKEEYSGITYIPDNDYVVTLPEWAAWTTLTPESLVLTIYVPGGKGRRGSSPREVRFKRQG
ncbi:hypothetical protein DSM104443_02214 [Usitatibacter rugosus]|uniref:Uncharacterized protein n=1 Tax=Usitatibacter rugosus TaxID=2732067 RepID=A0A6M4GXN0_9PROT|nr:hypothetical protein [Usitatibacter rugosus]QJR11143.1 hypothetical protein DSM104443_02214 [Usitatibacter rugosus]